LPDNFNPIFYQKVYDASVRCQEAQQVTQKAVKILLDNLNNKFFSNYDFIYD
jgi:hypothetical protein